MTFEKGVRASQYQHDFPCKNVNLSCFFVINIIAKVLPHFVLIFCVKIIYAKKGVNSYVVISYIKRLGGLAPPAKDNANIGISRTACVYQ